MSKSNPNTRSSTSSIVDQHPKINSPETEIKPDWQVDIEVSFGPLIVGDHVVVGKDVGEDDGPTMFSLDYATGEERWSLNLADEIENVNTDSNIYPIIAGSQYVFALSAEDRAVIAIDPAIGEVQWTSKPTVVGQSGHSIENLWGLVHENGYLYAGTEPAGYVAIDASTGDTVGSKLYGGKTLQEGPNALVTKTCEGQHLYTFALDEDMVIQWDIETATIDWSADEDLSPLRKEAQPSRLFTGIEVDSERVYIGCATEIVAIPRTGGEADWVVTRSMPEAMSPEMAEKKSLIVGADEYNQATTERLSVAGDPIVVGDTIYVAWSGTKADSGDEDYMGSVAAINTEDGKEQWRTSISGSVDALEVNSGQVLVGQSINHPEADPRDPDKMLEHSPDGGLVALDQTDGTENWAVSLPEKPDRLQSGVNGVFAKCKYLGNRCFVGLPTSGPDDSEDATLLVIGGGVAMFITGFILGPFNQTVSGALFAVALLGTPTIMLGRRFTDVTLPIPSPLIVAGIGAALSMVYGGVITTVAAAVVFAILMYPVIYYLRTEDERIGTVQD